jgi:hypothetical protein
LFADGTAAQEDEHGDTEIKRNGPHEIKRRSCQRELVEREKLKCLFK